VTTAPEGFVVVGVDGSDGSARALRWALDHADHLGEIRPVLLYESGPLVREVRSSDGSDDDPYRAAAVERLRSFLEPHAPWLVERAAVLEERPGPGLVHAASAAELLVVGTRGLSGRLDLSIGSIGSYCARHATAPVALIPGDAPPPHDHLDVVVGFDGSSHSRAALHWTLTHVLPTARVLVVQAYTDHTVVGEALSPSPDDTESTVRAELDDGVAAVLAHLDRHAAVATTAVPGDPRAVLRAAADDADLLVVGARGHGILDRLLLGSVSSALTHHPTAPTIVVPHRR
jgi:nucleotide-binding universal stress UspA family protein